MVITELVAKLGLKVDEQAFSRLTQSITLAKSGLLGLGAAFGAVVGTGLAFAKSVADQAGQIADNSQAVGVSTDALQELAHAAKLSGSTVEQMQGGLMLLAKNARSAADGTKTTADAFGRLGVRFKNADGSLRPVDEMLGDLAERFAGMPDGAGKTSAAMELLGRSGAALIPMLNNGRAGLAGMRQEARDLGIVMDAETIKAGDDFGDTLDRLKAAFLGVRNMIGGPLLRGFERIFKATIQATKANRGWLSTLIVKPIKALVDSLAWLSERMQLVKFILLSLASVYVGSLIPAMLKAITAVKLFGAESAFSAALAAGKALLIAGAWALIPLAIGLAVDDLKTFAEGGDSVFGDFMGWIQKVTEAGDDDWQITRMLKRSIRGIFDVQGYLQELQKEWATVWSAAGVYVGRVTTMIDTLAIAIRSGLGLAWEIVKREIRETGAAIAAIPGAQVAMELAGKAAGGVASAFGGGASPASSASAAPASARTDARAVNVGAITVNAAPGQNAEEIASQVSSQIQDFWNLEMQQSVAAVDY